MSFKLKWQVPEDAVSVRIYYSDRIVDDLSDAQLVELAGDVTEYDLDVPVETFYRVEVITPSDVIRSGWGSVEHTYMVPGAGGDRIIFGDSQYGVVDYGYLTRTFSDFAFGSLGATFSGDPRYVKVVYRGRVLYLIGGTSFTITVANLYKMGFCDFQHPDDKAAALARGEALENIFVYNGERYKIRLARPYAYDDPKTSAEMAAATPIFWSNSEMADIALDTYHDGARGLKEDSLTNKDGSITTAPGIRAAIRASAAFNATTATAPAYGSATTTIRQTYKGARSLWTSTAVTGNVVVTNLVIEYLGPDAPQA